MDQKRKRLAAGLNSIWEIPEQRPAVDFNQLGAGITRIPPYLWQERMFFMGASDATLRLLTQEFPQKIRGTHPLMILQAVSRLAVNACPCTSSPGPWTYIPRNTRLHITGRILDRISFVLEHLPFSIPRDEEFIHSLCFWGQVPAERLIRSH